MEAPASSTRRIRTGLFEVDFGSGEVYREGRKVALQEQPFRVLAVLLERPGEVGPAADAAFAPLAGWKMAARTTAGGQPVTLRMMPRAGSGTEISPQRPRKPGDGRSMAKTQSPFSFLG